MRQTLVYLKAKGSASSSRWLARQSKDPYVRLRTGNVAAASEGDAVYRSRSAFKLVSLAKKYPGLLGSEKVVVDLGAAPGGWSQVAAAAADTGRPGRGRVMAVDILPMQGIPGVDIIQGDFLDASVQQKVRSLVTPNDTDLSSAGIRDEKDGKEARVVDTVLSDMMAPMSGVRMKDIQASLDLVEAATVFARSELKVGDGSDAVVGTRGGRTVYGGGNMVLKYFAHPELDAFKREQLDGWFHRVGVEKPKESRSESSEAYFVCLGFKGTPVSK